MLILEFQISKLPQSIGSVLLKKPGFSRIEWGINCSDSSLSPPLISLHDWITYSAGLDPPLSLQVVTPSSRCKIRRSDHAVENNIVRVFCCGSAYPDLCIGRLTLSHTLETIAFLEPCGGQYKMTDCQFLRHILCFLSPQVDIFRASALPHGRSAVARNVLNTRSTEERKQRLRQG